MEASPLYLPLFPSLQRAHGRSAPQTHPSLLLPTSSAAPPLTKPFGRSRRFVPGRYSKDPPKEPWLPNDRDSPDGADENRSRFPLEYESVWDTKPPWCQPWTIMLTGASVIASSWLVWHSVILTALVVPLIAAWWHIQRCLHMERRGLKMERLLREGACDSTIGGIQNVFFMGWFCSTHSEMIAHGKKRVEDGAGAARGRG